MWTATRENARGPRKAHKACNNALESTPPLRATTNRGWAGSAGKPNKAAAKAGGLKPASGLLEDTVLHEPLITALEQLLRGNLAQAREAGGDGLL